MVAALRGFPALAELELNNVPLTDQGLKILLAPFPPDAPRPTMLDRLSRLSLAGTHITDDGLKYLASLRNLRELLLCSTRIGDEGAQHLAALRNLEILNVQDADISDVSLPVFHELPRLTLLLCIP